MREGVRPTLKPLSDGLEGMRESNRIYSVKSSNFLCGPLSGILPCELENHDP